MFQQALGYGSITPKANVNSRSGRHALFYTEKPNDVLDQKPIMLLSIFVQALNSAEFDTSSGSLF
jgi:hypothetical protein